ncbi:MAG: hypothetical protein GX915_08580 [Clostridiales bacterium]|nr:hypothetical protein [Clostridiales bacterium]
MVYIFLAILVFIMIKKKDQLLSAKRNVFLFIFLSIIGLTMGFIYEINPYIPTIAQVIGKYVK